MNILASPEAIRIIQDERVQIKRYLLGQLTEAGEERVELRLLIESTYAETFDRIENELVDEYLEGALSEEERLRFEQHFLKAPQRRDKLSFTTNLRAAARPPTPVARVSPEKHAARWYSSTPAYLKAAAVLIAILCVGQAAWLLLGRKSGEEPGIADLRAAYKNQRLVEARITKLDYAPLLITRRQEKPNVDETLLRRAELQLLKELDEQPGANAQHAVGRFYLAGRQFDKAIQHLEIALQQEPNNAQIHSDLGAAFLELGKADLSLKEEGKSAEYFAKSLVELNRAIELNESLLEALYNRAVLRQYLTLTQQAKDDWRKYLEKDSSSPWADEARQNLQRLEGQNQINSQNKEYLYQEFLNAVQAGDDGKAWRALRRSRFRTGNAIVERLLDNYLELATQGRNEEANIQSRMLSRVAEIEGREVGDKFTSDLAQFYRGTNSSDWQALVQARNLVKLANDCYNRSEFEQAADLYTQAESLFEGKGNVGEALFARSWVGYCRLRIPDTQGSLSIFEKLLRVSKVEGYKSLEARSLHALSDAQTSLSQFSKAIEYAERSLELSEEIQDDEQVLRCLQQLVYTNLELGKYQKSLGFGFRALYLSQGLSPAPNLVWPFYSDIALNFYTIGFTAVALDFQKETVRLAIESKMPLLRSRSYARLGLIYERLQNYDEAIRNGILALEEAQYIMGERSRLNSVAHSSLQLGHVYRQTGDLNRAITCYNQAIQHYERLEFHNYLFEAHKGRLLAFIDLRDDLAATEELDKALKLFERYRWAILEESNRNSFFDAGQNVYDIATNFAYTRMGDPRKALEYTEASRARSLLDLVRADGRVIAEESEPDIKHASVSHPLTLAEIQRRLPEQVQLLQYSVLDDRLLIWVISKEKVESKVQEITADELNRTILDYLRLILNNSESSRAAEQTRARELYTMLISPVSSFLDGQKQLFIIPDKILNHLPYSALISPTTGRYFVEENLFALSPSSNIFLACSDVARRRVVNGKETLLSVGNPSFDRSRFPMLPDLPSAGREVKEVAAFYNSTPFIGSTAKEELIKKEIEQADIIHLASHYVVDDRSPMLSGLLLATETPNIGSPRDADGILQGFEVYKMRMPRTRLVVLSACQTGVERSYRGEGAVGIARPFIKAGVPIVVASLWPVDTDSTAKMMIQFHRYRKQEGLSTITALRRAQLDLLSSSDARERRPSGWASFAAIGGFAEF